NYFLLTVTHKTNPGLTMTQVVKFLQDNIHPEWAYNLDGGPSSALLARSNGDKKLKTIYGNNSKDTDIMAFAELPAEP
ncbi:MAG: phosphodiester glycosidase family protein, partial [Clostridia bacterium]|nr:phosphodiester glycosidase family protein [Clostridia bacterium]